MVDKKDGNKKRRSLHVKPSHVEEDGEAWLISYADLMTLLFGLFVVLFSFSKPDAEKFEVLRKEASKSLKGDYKNTFDAVNVKLTQVMRELKLDRQVTIKENIEGLAITSEGTLFFESGSSLLKEEADALMRQIALVLKQQSENVKIVVEGHTDDSPIATKLFPSNWELSSARAGTVVRLLENTGISKNYLRPIGLADIEPLVPNRDSSGTPITENQAKNRRIVIRVQKQL